MWGSLFHLFFFLFLFLHLKAVLSSPFNLSSSPSLNKLCSPEQSFALLHFKNSLSVQCDNSQTNSWKENIDCCSWDGVTCDTFTGHVIGLDLSSGCLFGTIHDNSTLFLLRRLQKLNLADNYFFVSNLSSNFGKFTELTYLNLSESSFSGPVPTEISCLSKLVSLDISSSVDLSQDIFNKMLQNLTKLRYLHLDRVNMSSVAPASLVNLSSSLISLSLDSTNLEGRFPSDDIFRLPFLQHLKLSNNGLLTGCLPKANWSGPLRFLDLSDASSFSSQLPDTIGNLKHLEVLHLASSNFRGSIPASLGNLTEIISLDLSSNNIAGGIPHFISNLWELTSLDFKDNNFSGQFPDVFGNLSKLTHLSLSINTFSGHISSSAFNLTRIRSLDFSFNKFEGQIPSQVSGLSDLTELDFSYNFLSGEIPLWLFTLPSLDSLDLSNNRLTGPFPNIMFPNFNLTRLNLSSNNLSDMLKPELLSKLRNLEMIDLSHNNHLSLRPHGNTNFTLPELDEFRFSSCKLTRFPSFLEHARALKILDLSSNKISGHISLGHFGFYSRLWHLDLSQNFLTSVEQIPSESSIEVLDLHSNLLQGPLLDLPTDISYFSASNNKLTGEIPSSICNLTFIQYLILSNNSFSEKIPQCLGMDNSDLEFLDLGMNNLHGNIPQTVAVSSIQYLNLNGNRLVGPLPHSLVNCRKLQVLDVGMNRINDTFPHWLASLPELQVLILRANRFHGPVGKSNVEYPFSELRIVDISHNQFTGLLPSRYFENSKSIMHRPYDNAEAIYMQGTPQPHFLVSHAASPKNKVAVPCGRTYAYASCLPSEFEISRPYYSVVVTLKGVDITMKRIFTAYTIIDFSNNLFQGGIPGALGKLVSLKVLNFSQNKLTGEIPLSLGSLTELESLDLSSNKLIGEIPIQLANLTFLEVLNLSHNQLVGHIPQGKQFGTFSNESFIGNLGLCGLPLSKECNHREVDAASGPTTFFEEDDALSWFEWKVIMMGYGCGMVIGWSTAYIVFVTRKPQWFVRMVERRLSIAVRRLSRRRRGFYFLELIAREI